MKRLLYFFVLSFSIAYGQFIEFTDSCSKNRFLGPNRSICKIETNNSTDHYQKGYDCGNGTVSELLNVNFFAPGVLETPFYIFNDFMYWMRKDVKKGYSNNFSPDSQFSGGGVFMVMIGSSPYLQQLVAPQKTCPEGQNMIIAQLKYNNGSSLTTWSQDAICLAPTDKFKIQMSEEKDDTAPAYIGTTLIDQAKTGTLVDAGSQESGPSPVVYDQANSSPRKIRLIKQS